MKNILVLVFLLVSCTDHTKYGKCLGFDDNEKRDPNLVYDFDVGNAFLAALTIETIIIPIMWATDSVYCPTGKKEK